MAKALIRLCGCAGRPESFLFACSIIFGCLGLDNKVGLVNAKICKIRYMLLCSGEKIMEFNKSFVMRGESHSQFLSFQQALKMHFTMNSTL